MSRLFPIELLDAEPTVRLKYFAESSIEHPKLAKATKMLRLALKSQVKGSIIFVYGPTGVGKTTLCEHVINEIIEENTAIENNQERKEIPAAFIDAAAPHNNRFEWKYFYQHAVFSMENSIKERKKHKFTRYNPRLAPALYFNQNLKPCEYRNHFIDALRRHQPFGFFIDEAQHLARVSSSDTLLNQMDIIKTLRKFSQTKIILIGPYDLLNFRDLSGQLSRRGLNIHFPRYGTTQTDVKNFQSALHTLLRKLPLEIQPDLTSRWKYIYAKTVGCVGTMKDWLTRALEIAFDENEKTITLDILVECALSDHQSLNIALEISNGEERINSTKESYKNLVEAVGFKKKNDKPPENTSRLEFLANQQRRKNKPGRRRAKRDAIS